MSVLDRFQLANRVAIVTGGNRGLGKEMVKALAEAGAQVAVVSRQLGAFARDGYVSMTRGSIIVLRPDILESLAHPEL